MRGRGQYRSKTGYVYVGVEGALTSLGRIDTVKTYPILITYVFVNIC
jgi:hypothetical protein